MDIEEAAEREFRSYQRQIDSLTRRNRELISQVAELTANLSECNDQFSIAFNLLRDEKLEEFLKQVPDRITI